MSQETEGTRAILLGYCALNGDSAAKDASMEELERLTHTADIITLGTYVQRRAKIHPRTFIGEGFIETSLAHAENNEAGGKADLPIFDHDLTGSQARNIEKTLFPARHRPHRSDPQNLSCPCQDEGSPPSSQAGRAEV